MAEKAGSIITCNAIVKHTCGLVGEGLEEEDRERIWLEEAESAF